MRHAWSQGAGAPAEGTMLQQVRSSCARRAKGIQLHFAELWQRALLLRAPTMMRLTGLVVLLLLGAWTAPIQARGSREPAAVPAAIRASCDTQAPLQMPQGTATVARRLAATQATGGWRERAACVGVHAE